MLNTPPLIPDIKPGYHFSLFKFSNLKYQSYPGKHGYYQIPEILLPVYKPIMKPLPLS